jgi:hypothetical protein
MLAAAARPRARTRTGWLSAARDASAASAWSRTRDVRLLGEHGDQQEDEQRQQVLRLRDRQGQPRLDEKKS